MVQTTATDRDFATALTIAPTALVWEMWNVYVLLSTHLMSEVHRMPLGAQLGALINVGVGVTASFLAAIFVFLIFAAFIAVGFLLSGAIAVVGRANNRE